MAIPDFSCCPHMAELRAALQDAELKLVIASADLEIEKELTGAVVSQLEHLLEAEIEKRSHRSWEPDEVVAINET